MLRRFMQNAARYQWFVLGVVATLLALAGAWLGNGDASLLSSGGMVCVAAAWLINGAVCRRWRHRLVGAALLLVVFGCAWWFGNRDRGLAYNEWMVQGEDVRTDLASFRAKHGRFPATLSHLRTSLPGRRLLRGQLAHYTVGPHGDGYKLLYGDWLVTFYASDTEPFSPHK